MSEWAKECSNALCAPERKCAAGVVYEVDNLTTSIIEACNDALVVEFEASYIAYEWVAPVCDPPSLK